MASWNGELDFLFALHMGHSDAWLKHPWAMSRNEIIRHGMNFLGSSAAMNS
jgi:hypothetical protein